jgi:hypothetical protein
MMRCYCDSVLDRCSSDIARSQEDLRVAVHNLGEIDVVSQYAELLDSMKVVECNFIIYQAKLARLGEILKKHEECQADPDLTCPNK